MRRLDFDLNLLVTYVTVYEAGSIAAAASELNLTPSAVSQQLAKLEQTFPKLVEVVGRKRSKPTRNGVKLYGYAKSLEGIANEAIDDLNGSASIETVTIGTGQTACTYVLPPVLQALGERRQELEFVVSTGNTTDVLRDIERGMVDVGLVVTIPGVAPRDFHFQGDYKDELVAVWHRSRKLPQPVTPASLEDKPLILYEPAGNTRAVVETWFKEGRAHCQPMMSLGSVEAAKRLAAAGLGCAILPRMAMVDAGKLGLKVSSLKPPLSRILAVVRRKGRVVKPAISEVIAALHRELATKLWKIDC